MNTRIFEAFDEREQQVTDYMAGCGQKYGMPCTCGPDCRCKNCSEHCKESQHAQREIQGQTSGGCCAPANGLPTSGMEPQGMMYQMPQSAMDVGGAMLSSPGVMSLVASQQRPDGFPMAQRSPSFVESDQMVTSRSPSMLAMRNSSILSYGQNYGRHMSINSETTFGRAMSGLSALSIDWENMEDFDVNVDHSAHINNGINAASRGVAPQDSEKDGIAAVSARFPFVHRVFSLLSIVAH